jgi:hypothetical protein
MDGLLGRLFAFLKMGYMLVWVGSKYAVKRSMAGRMAWYELSGFGQNKKTPNKLMSGAIYCNLNPLL